MKALILNADVVRSTEDNGPDIMQFYGVLENGKNFIWEESKSFQVCYRRVTTEQTESESGFVDFRKNSVEAMFFPSQKAMGEWLGDDNNKEAELLQSKLVATNHFLISKGIQGVIEFTESPDSESFESESSEDIFFFKNPKFKVIKLFDRSQDNLKKIKFIFNRESPFFPLKMVSLDIETGMKDNLLYSIALYGDGVRKVLMLSNGSMGKGKRETHKLKSDIGDYELEYLSTEKELLLFFLEEVKRINPQIFVGWYVVGFDFDYLVKKFDEHKIDFNLGINDLPVVAFKTERSKNLSFKIPGRVVLEGMDLVKNRYKRLPNLKLDTASEYILGEKKLIQLTDKNKTEEIERQFKEEPLKLAEYNLSDTKLVFDIFEKLDGVRFAMIRSLLSGCSVEKVDIPSEVMDHYYLPRLYQKKIVAYDPPKGNVTPRNDLGDHEFVRELYDDVFLIDFKDLYPFIILSYRIDPLGMVRAQSDRENAISTAVGDAFHKSDHLLPQIIYDLSRYLNLNDLSPEDESKFKSLIESIWDSEISQILFSLGGGTRFYLPGLIEAIRENVQFVMESMTRKLELLPEVKVIYFDNQVLTLKYSMAKNGGDLADPIYTKVSLISNDIKKKIKDQLTEDFFKKILPLGKIDHEVFPKLSEIKYYPKFFLLSEVARLRPKTTINYQAITEEGDWMKHGSTRYDVPLTKEFTDLIVKKILKEESVEDALKEFKLKLKSGDFDYKLIYKKRLTKELSEYTANPPPQVIAARKIESELMERKRLGFNYNQIEFVQTVNGPEPTLKIESEINYQHYLDKELLPAIERLLGGTRFQSLVDIFKSDGFQLSLF